MPPSDLPDLLRRVLSNPRDTAAWSGLCEGGEGTFRLLESRFHLLPVRSLLRALLIELELPDKPARLSALYRAGEPLTSALVAPVLAHLGGAEAEAALRRPPPKGPTADWVEALDLLDQAWVPALLDEHLGPAWEALEQGGVSALPTRLQRPAGLQAMVCAAVVGARAGDERARGRAYAAAIHGVSGDTSLAASVRRSAILRLRTLAAPGLLAALVASVGVGGEGASLALEGLGDLGRPEVLLLILQRRQSPSTRESANAALRLLVGPPPPSAPTANVSAELAPRLAAGTCYAEGSPATMERRLDLVRRHWPGARLDLTATARLPGLHSGPDSLPLTPRESSLLDEFWPARAADFPPGKLHRWGRSYDPSVVDGPLPELPELRRG